MENFCWITEKCGQFLLIVTMAALHVTKRWWIYHMGPTVSTTLNIRFEQDFPTKEPLKSLLPTKFRPDRSQTTLKSPVSLKPRKGAARLSTINITPKQTKTSLQYLRRTKDFRGGKLVEPTAFQPSSLPAFQPPSVPLLTQTTLNPN